MSAPYDPNAPVYAPPPYVPPPPESRVQGPAIGLLIGGGIALLLWILRTVVTVLSMTFLGAIAMSDPSMQNDPSALAAFTGMGLLGVAVSIIPIAMNALICFGAWKLMRLESYTWAMVAAILALIPCQPPCCLITMPFGIWALVLLQEPAIKDRLMGTATGVGQIFE